MEKHIQQTFFENATDEERAEWAREGGYAPRKKFAELPTAQPPEGEPSKPDGSPSTENVCSSPDGGGPVGQAPIPLTGSPPAQNETHDCSSRTTIPQGEGGLTQNHNDPPNDRRNDGYPNQPPSPTFFEESDEENEEDETDVVKEHNGIRSRTTDSEQRAVLEEIQAAAAEIANLASKNSALKKPSVVERILQARWMGVVKMKQISSLCGIAHYTTVEKYLRWGREKKSPVYEKFAFYFDYFLHRSGALAREVVQHQAHTPGNYKQAIEFLKMIYPEEFDEKRADGSTQIYGDVNVQVIQQLQELQTMPFDELLDFIHSHMHSLPNDVRDHLMARIDPTAAAELERLEYAQQGAEGEDLYGSGGEGGQGGAG